jgi:succinoglycan biosynthesis transport protein ExoP
MVTRQKQDFDLSLAGLQYFRLKDYKRLLARRKWLIVITATTVALLTSVVVYFIPNSYKATTTILIDPGKVPESYVKSTATLTANERLALLRQQILSDTKLSQIIDDMGLYSELKKKEAPMEVTRKMREDIDLDPVSYATGGRPDLTAFTISYHSSSSATAAAVANRLASLFIEENLRAREEQVLGTAEFIDRELAKARQDLEDKESKLAALRAKYASELPEAQNAHLQALATLQLEVRGEMDAISRDQQQKVYLQSLMADSPQVVDLDTSTAGSAPTGLEDQLSRLETQREQLRSRYGPQFPDVLKLQHEIDDLQQKINSAKKSEVSTAPPTVLRPHNPVIDSQIGALDKDVLAHNRRLAELKSEIGYHQSMLDRAPAAAQQIAILSRDYEQAEENYKRLQDHKFAADISTDMENRQKGERFLILEPAQPPALPYEPQRPLIDGLGLLAGIVIALGLVLALELFDRTVKTEHEVTDQLQVPILAEIPWFDTTARKRRQQLRTVFAAGGSTLLLLVYVGAIAVSLRK